MDEERTTREKGREGGRVGQGGRCIGSRSFRTRTGNSARIREGGLNEDGAVIKCGKCLGRVFRSEYSFPALQGNRQRIRGGGVGERGSCSNPPHTHTNTRPFQTFPFHTLSRWNPTSNIHTLPPPHSHTFLVHTLSLWNPSCNIHTQRLRRVDRAAWSVGACEKIWGGGALKGGPHSKLGFTWHWGEMVKGKWQSRRECRGLPIPYHSLSSHLVHHLVIDLPDLSYDLWIYGSPLWCKRRAPTWYTTLSRT